MLSTRKLMFTEGQIIFECERGVWYEDVKMENDRMTLEKEVPFLHPPEKGSLSDGFPTYMDCVKECTRRVLTYPEDILDGICRDYEPSQSFHGFRRLLKLWLA
jgi:hypothetical protein